MTLHKVLVVIEYAGATFPAGSPDPPGCVATGATRELTDRIVLEAIRLHTEGRCEDELPIPESSSFGEVVLIPASFVSLA